MRESLIQFLFANCQAISSHFVTVHSWSVRCSQRSQKSIKTPYFRSSRSFKVIDVDTIEKLVTSACCDRQHAQGLLERAVHAWRLEIRVRRFGGPS